MSRLDSHAQLCADVERRESFTAYGVLWHGVEWDIIDGDVQNGGAFIVDPYEALEPMSSVPHCLAWLARQLTDWGINPAAWAFDSGEIALDHLTNHELPWELAMPLMDVDAIVEAAQ